jgi:photosystem II stability/assembly factor-like uncharacterized protein
MCRASAVVVGAAVCAAAMAAAVGCSTARGPTVRASNAQATSGAPSPPAGSAGVSIGPGVGSSASTPTKPTVAVETPLNSGLVSQFAVVTPTVWWAVVQTNVTAQTFVVRSVDAGQHWHDATPKVSGLRSDSVPDGYFLSADVGWLAINQLSDSADTPAAPLYRTGDGGHSWQRIGTTPDHDCALDFVDALHGWCTVLVGAAGSMPVSIYRTTDGGSIWALISRTAVDPDPSTAGALPFGCDKTLTFTSPTQGFASSFCNGGEPYLDVSTDSGAHWQPFSPVPFPGGTTPSGGAGLSVPAVDGRNMAVVNLGGLGPGASAITTSVDGGNSWHTHPMPATNGYWNVDLIDSMHWRATDGHVIEASDDAGAHWRHWTPNVSLLGQYQTPLNMHFLNPLIGLAAADPAGNQPQWSTADGGMTWEKITIQAGPYVLP